MALTDYDKTFDAVGTSAVMRALRKQGVDEHSVGILEDIYNGNQRRVT